MLSRHGKIFLIPVVVTNKVKTNSRYFVGVFSETITLLALVGYEIIIANSSLRAWLPTTISLHTRTRGIIGKSPVYPCISSTIEYPVIRVVAPEIIDLFKSLCNPSFLSVPHPGGISDKQPFCIFLRRFSISINVASVRGL